MRSIYLGKSKSECPNCGGPKVIYPVGWTFIQLANGKSKENKPVYGCKDDWHKRTIRQGEV